MSAGSWSFEPETLAGGHAVAVEDPAHLLARQVRVAASPLRPWTFCLGSRQACPDEIAGNPRVDDACPVGQARMTMPRCMPRNAQSSAEPLTHRPNEPRRFAGPAFAALDLGTNNCRMLVAAPSGDGFRVLDSFSRIVRLGEGLHRTGQLSAGGDGSGAGGAAGLRGAAGAAPGAQAARHRHRGVPARGQWRRVPRPGEGTRPDWISASSPPARRPSWRWKAARRCWRAGGGGRCCSISAAARPSWPGCGIDPNGRPELIGYDSLPVGVVTLAERFGQAGFDPDGFEAMVDDVAARLASFEAVHCIAPRDPRRRRAVAGHQRHGHDAGGGGAGAAALSAAAGGRHGADRARRPMRRWPTCGRWDGRGWRRIPASAPSGWTSCCPAARCLPRWCGCGRRRG